ncbi:hypothetical protein [Desulfonema ishimotonii]|uniref:hypothetical protein n=1 Tax=Desulfonema ishimotonii TaxID=45657 RepID=UPI000F57E28D|nr:hypothetical protein [Desulfonema ishimotonii]
MQKTASNGTGTRNAKKQFLHSGWGRRRSAKTLFKERKNSFLHIGISVGGVRRKKTIFALRSGAKKERKNSFKERKNSFLHIGISVGGVAQKNNFCTPVLHSGFALWRRDHAGERRDKNDTEERDGCPGSKCKDFLLLKF